QALAALLHGVSPRSRLVLLHAARRRTSQRRHAVIAEIQALAALLHGVSPRSRLVLLHAARRRTSQRRHA
ncbi:hypothetical protein C0U44_32285, partial [Klebsiella pneumoniae]